jgi:cytochrome c-type biogenesis protein CcmH/NrfG
VEGDRRDREPVKARGRPLSTGFLIFRAAAATILVLVVLVGAWLAVGAGRVAADAAGQPVEPPGQLGVAALILVAAVGAGIALAAVGGLVLLAWVSRRKSRARGG